MNLDVICAAILGPFYRDHRLPPSQQVATPAVTPTHCAYQYYQQSLAGSGIKMASPFPGLPYQISSHSKVVHTGLNSQIYSAAPPRANHSPLTCTMAMEISLAMYGQTLTTMAVLMQETPWSQEYRWPFIRTEYCQATQTLETTGHLLSPTYPPRFILLKLTPHYCLPTGKS